MKGYLKNRRRRPNIRWRLVPFRRSAVMQPDGYVKIKDRSKTSSFRVAKHQLDRREDAPTGIPP
jgi:hypothetical protein